MATIVAAAGGGDWNTGSSWIGGNAPTAADNAQVPSTAGNMSIGAGAVCRGADFSTYTGTLSGTGTLTIGDATAALSSIALKLVAGMSVSGPPLFNFISTSATVQTVDFAGKTVGNVAFNAASNGSWQLTGALNGGISMQVTLTQGTLDMNGQTLNIGVFNSSNGNTRSLTLGGAAITVTNGGSAWNTSNTTGLTFAANTSAITVSGTSAGFVGGGLTYNTLNLTGAGTQTLSGINTFTNLNRTGTASKTDFFQIFANQTVSGILTLAGNSATNRLLVQSDTAGTARIITNVGATMTWSNVDFQDITLGTAFDASAITGNSGDCGGNTGITFTPAATQTATGTISFLWSTHGWTSRVPLPQDNVVINNAFIAGRTVTADMPRLGKSIDWTGTTGTPAWSFASTTTTVYGSITLITGMTLSGTNATTLAGRSTFTLTSATQQYPQALSINAPSGTYTLADAFSTAGNLSLTNGGFNAATFNVTFFTFNGSNSNTRSLTMGTAIWTSTSTNPATNWALSNTSGLTFSGASATIVLSLASASTRTFDGGGLTYGILTYTVAGSTGQLNIIGSNSFSVINFSDVTNARSLLFTAGTTTTIRNGNGFNVFGTSGKNMTVDSITASNHTLTSSSQQGGNINYLTLGHSIADASPKWYAGANSTDGGTNTNWVFTAAPIMGSGSVAASQSIRSIQNLMNL